MNLFVKFWLHLELLLQYEKKRLVKKSFEILGKEKEYDKISQFKTYQSVIYIKLCTY